MNAVGADDIVAAIEATLQANIPAVQQALGFEHLGSIATWQIVPDHDALATAVYPAVAVVAPFVSGPPERKRSEYAAVWEASVGIFARGNDHAHTQLQIAQWAKVIRASVVLKPTLTGTRFGVRWVGERTDLIPEQSKARTLAGAEVMFDVSVDKALDTSAVTPLPPVLSVHPDVIPE